jgi:hypothetical protein
MSQPNLNPGGGPAERADHRPARRSVNNNPTNYQVTALGVSQEDGKYYDQIESGKIALVNCGHA